MKRSLLYYYRYSRRHGFLRRSNRDRHVVIIITIAIIITSTIATILLGEHRGTRRMETRENERYRENFTRRRELDGDEKKGFLFKLSERRFDRKLGTFRAEESRSRHLANRRLSSLPRTRLSCLCYRELFFCSSWMNIAGKRLPKARRGDATRRDRASSI